MNKKKKLADEVIDTEVVVEETIVTPETETEVEAEVITEEAEVNPLAEMVQGLMAQQEEKYLRLAAEYDNFRKRSNKEKESIWTDVKRDTASIFLPVYDNLERALKQETADEAFKKGVEMTMSQLKEVMTKLGIETIDCVGKPFDPNLHNAVMHIDDENLGENIISEVFQNGFIMGEKVVRFAMVQVAN